MRGLNDERFSLSVIVPTYNRAQQLASTLKSLAEQTLAAAEFEIVVVDDGSDDQSFEVAKSFENLVNLTYAYQADRGYRVSSARNLGIRLAQGRVCLFLDSGVIAHSDCLQQHLARHRNAKRAVAVIGYTFGWGADDEHLNELVDPDDADTSIVQLSRDGVILDIRENIFRKYEYRIEDLSVPWTLLYGGHFSAPTSSLFQVGLFDERYDGNWGAEDQDIGYRLHLAGLQIVLCRAATVLHLPLAIDRVARSEQGFANCHYFHQKYQTPETRVFLGAYDRDVARQISHREVVDFHELVLADRSDIATTDGPRAGVSAAVLAMPSPPSRTNKTRS